MCQKHELVVGMRMDGAGGLVVKVLPACKGPKFESQLDPILSAYLAS